MDFQAFLDQVRAAPGYADQMVHVREVAPRAARYAETTDPLPDPVRAMLAARGIGQLYSHQAEAVDRARRGENVLLSTGTASGKTLGYAIPLIETLTDDPDARALMLFPTKALCQDQFRSFRAALDAAVGRIVAALEKAGAV